MRFMQPFVSPRVSLIVALMLAFLATPAFAQQRVYWRDTDPAGQSPQADPYDADDNPTGWRDTNGGNTDEVTIQPGKSIYFGIMNTENTRKKVVKLSLRWLKGDVQKFAKPTATGYVNGQPVAGYISTGANKKKINASWTSCPAWEFYTITNFTSDPQDVQITPSVAPTLCHLPNAIASGAAGDSEDSLGVGSARAGVLPGMLRSVRSGILKVFPEHQPVNPKVMPTFNAPPHTGFWTSSMTFDDPNGRLRPEGGIEFRSDGLGLLTEDMFEFMITMHDSMDTRYTLYMHDEDTDEWYEYILDLQRLPWYEDFEIYDEGELVHGASNWQGWDNDPAFDAPVTSANFRSEPYSLEVNENTDIVRTFEGADEGSWTFECWQYIPSDFASGGGGDDFDGSYFVMLNTYEDGTPHEEDHWSVQMQFDPNDGLLKVYHGDGLNTIDVPYETDRWVKIQAEIDLAEDWTEIFYDDKLVTKYAWVGGVIGGLVSQSNIGAVNLFANGTSSVYYDDMSLVRNDSPPPPCPADLTGDGELDFFDVSAFLSAFTNQDPAADFLNDGLFDFFDVSAFLSAFSAGCP